MFLNVITSGPTHSIMLEFGCIFKYKFRSTCQVPVPELGNILYRYLHVVGTIDSYSQITSQLPRYYYSYSCTSYIQLDLELQQEYPGSTSSYHYHVQQQHYYYSCSQIYITPVQLYPGSRDPSICTRSTLQSCSKSTGTTYYEYTAVYMQLL